MTILSFRFISVRSPDELASDITSMRRDPAIGSRLLWNRLDARDAALACRLAVEADKVGSGSYNITGSRVVLEETTAELVERFCGGCTNVKTPLLGHTRPVSCSKAEAAFGFQPRFVWSVSQSHLETDALV